MDYVLRDVRESLKLIQEDDATRPVRPHVPKPLRHWHAHLMPLFVNEELRLFWTFVLHLTFVSSRRFRNSSSACSTTLVRFR